jgi:SAM-dependent methyltransferase
MVEPVHPTANADQIAYWNETAGETWVAMQARLDKLIEPLGRAAMDALAIRRGEQLLDIGCGCGQTTLALAGRVGPAGGVLGVDISRPMLAVARRAIAGFAQASVIEADAQVCAFEPGARDAAFSRFGVMFFADPPAAFDNVRKALRSGGRLAFVCWRTFAEQPWMNIPLAAALQHFESPTPPDPDAPGPFAFADPERVRRILDAAGFGDIAIKPHDQMTGPQGLDEAVEVALRVGPLGALLREQPGKTEAVVRSVREALQTHLGEGGVSLASAVWIVTARAP